MLIEGHTEKLIMACKGTGFMIAVVAINALTKFLSRKETHDLRKYFLTLIHA
jgi:hypothetical protein